MAGSAIPINSKAWAAATANFGFALRIEAASAYVCGVGLGVDSKSLSFAKSSIKTPGGIVDKVFEIGSWFGRSAVCIDGVGAGR